MMAALIMFQGAMLVVCSVALMRGRRQSDQLRVLLSWPVCSVCQQRGSDCIHFQSRLTDAQIARDMHYRTTRPMHSEV